VSLDDVRRYLEKAERAVSAARILLNADSAEGACNRAYYAMFDAAHAALLAAGVSVKTHSGLIGAFGKHLVQSGLIDAQHGRALNRVHHLRQLADYLGDPVTIEDAAESFAHAQAFIAAVKAKFLAAGAPEK
jgi:uncharacterized protein (UPF0332 family)